VPARARLALIVLATLVLAGAAAVLVVARPHEDASGRGFAGSIRPAIPPRDFRLRDQDGRAATLRQYRGRVLVLTFLYSACRDTCPITASTVGAAVQEAGGDVPALSVSVDPATDTPGRARRFLARRGLTGRMRFLLGARADLEPVWSAYGISPQGIKGDDGAFEHNAYVLLIDRRGRQRVAFPFGGLTADALAHDIRVLRAERAG
jgi:protein SCO1/2